jgi:predicted metal-dependent hydrolase
MTALGQQDPSCFADDRFQQAVNLFNHQDLYAAHDAFEDLWHESIGEERSLLQGIIQVAVAEHHLSAGNLRGALLLMAEGLNHLRSSTLGAPALDLLCLQNVVYQRLSALQSGQSLLDMPLPHLVLVVPDKD